MNKGRWALRLKIPAMGLGHCCQSAPAPWHLCVSGVAGLLLLGVSEPSLHRCPAVPTER